MTKEREIPGFTIDALRQQAFQLPPADQYRLAFFIAENVGYVLAPEPEHPDSPHAQPPTVRERELLGNLPLRYIDGPDYCTVKDATDADFALTVQPELMQLMERAALSVPPGEQAREAVIEECAKTAEGTAPIMAGNFFEARRAQCAKIAAAIRALASEVKKP